MTEEKEYSVVCVEDDPLILEILAFKFQKKNWQVVSAMDGETALKRISESKPDIVLLDILLPGISGYDVLEQLKKDSELQAIPVLVLSNYGQDEEIQKSLSLGAVDHLVKANVVLDDVVEVAKKIIENDYASNKNASV